MNSVTWISPTGYFLASAEEKTVFEAAQDRCRKIMSWPQKPVVSFSGGKDSTCVLMMMLGAATEAGRLPMDVVMFDEELIDPDTIEYVRQVAAWPELSFHWFCVPVQHTLLSDKRAHWLTWDPAERARWGRAMPSQAITEIDGYVPGKMGIKEAIFLYYAGEEITDSTGIRMEESFNRLRNVLMAGTWIQEVKGGKIVKPIYDWRWQDVWRAVLLNSWPHSAFYDKQWLKGVSPKRQRVAPWGNVAAPQEAAHYAEFYGEFWERAIRRLPELRAAARYGMTGLYRKAQRKPRHMTWAEYCYHLIEQNADPEVRAFWKRAMEQALSRWRRKFGEIPFPGAKASRPIVDGKELAVRTWQDFAAMIAKNDLFQGRSRDMS